MPSPTGVPITWGIQRIKNVPVQYCTRQHVAGTDGGASFDDRGQHRRALPKQAFYRHSINIGGRHLKPP